MSIKPEELRPCPFCGRNLDMTDGDTLHPNGVGWTQQGDYRNYDRAIGLPKSQWCYVACCSEASGGCGAEMSGDSRQEAIDKWNARAIPATHRIVPVELLERVLRALPTESVPWLCTKLKAIIKEPT